MSWSVVIGTVIGVTVGVPLANAIRPLGNGINQYASQMWPNELLPPQALIEAKRRDLINDNHLKLEMMKQGINEERTDLLFKTNEQLLSGMDIVQLWRRKIIDEDTRNSSLSKLGFSSENIELIIRATEQVPTADDVIRFAVREAYSPSVIAEFGQYEGAEEVIATAKDDIEATGITQDAFKKYWAAHWELPSILQGFEMLHRGVIDDGQLDLLQKAADVMPFWRDKLKAIAYNPYTRVDVRRMHKLGILTEDQVFQSYKDLGYDDEKALNLAYFTIEYNDGVAEAEETRQEKKEAQIKEAAQGAVIKAYKDNVIRKDEAVTHLQALKYTADSIQLLLDTADYEVQDAITQERIDIAHDAYLKNVWDHITVVAKLGELNLPGKQTAALIDKWEVEKQAKPAKLSKTELWSMYNSKIISADFVTSELKAMGYDDKYITLYFEANKKKVKTE